MNAGLSSPPFGAWARRKSRHARRVIKHTRHLMQVATPVIPLCTHVWAHLRKSSHQLGGDRARNELQVSVVESSGVPRRHNSLKKKLIIRPTTKLLEVCGRFFSSNDVVDTPGLTLGLACGGTHCMHTTTCGYETPIIRAPRSGKTSWHDTEAKPKPYRDYLYG